MSPTSVFNSTRTVSGKAATSGGDRREGAALLALLDIRRAAIAAMMYRRVIAFVEWHGARTPIVALRELNCMSWIDAFAWLRRTGDEQETNP